MFFQDLLRRIRLAYAPPPVNVGFLLILKMIISLDRLVYIIVLYLYMNNVLLRIRTASCSWIIMMLLVKGSRTARIVRQKEQESIARVETGALGRLVYGIISTLCLCALSFALGVFAN